MVFHSKSMVFILPGALEVFQKYTILYYGKFIVSHITMGLWLEWLEIHLGKRHH